MKSNCNHRFMTICALIALASACGGGTIEDALDTTGTSSAALGSSSADPILVGAGDISICGSSGDDDTALLLDQLFNGSPDAGSPAGGIFTAGDNSNGSGAASEYTNCFDPTWGKHLTRIRPSAGNHDYQTIGARPYYTYFGSAAGAAGAGYYSYDVGTWHIVVLNSNCSSVGGCNAGSAQEQWLRSDLTAHSAACTLAYWHHPRFSSGEHGNAAEVQPLWQALYDFNAEVVINGHDHDYERFQPQTPSGSLDTARGIREFVVGTGGAGQRSFSTTRRNSVVRHSGSLGVIKFTLHEQSYDWLFIATSGDSFTDSGSGTCH